MRRLGDSKLANFNIDKHCDIRNVFGGCTKVPSFVLIKHNKADVFFAALSDVHYYTKALYTSILGGGQSGVPKDSMIKVCLGYRNIDEIFKLLKKKMN